jgi:hypothetical protein
LVVGKANKAMKTYYEVAHEKREIIVGKILPIGNEIFINGH